MIIENFFAGKTLVKRLIRGSTEAQEKQGRIGHFAM